MISKPPSPPVPDEAIRPLRREARLLGRGFGRRAFLLGGAALAATSLAHADGIQVPFSVQAGLIAKVANFDRNFAARAGGKALVLVMVMPGDAESAGAAQELKSSLSRVPTVGDLPHEEQIVNYTGAAALADMVRARKAAIVYVGPGFGKELSAIRNALSKVSVLTVGSMPDYVSSGIVLGFDLVSGRPKLLVNLEQARKQNVDFPASVLRLMKVYP
jgi:YfiR/HmsC-like